MAEELDRVADLIPSKPVTAPPSSGRVSLTYHPGKDAVVQKKRRANSTSTIYAENTMAKPAVDENIYAVALIIHDFLSQDSGHALSGRGLAVGRKFNLDPYSRRVQAILDFEKATSFRDVYKFIKPIFVKGQLSHECNIMALYYLEQLLRNTKMSLTEYNWRHVTMGAYLLASKVWDDLSMINEDFTVVCPLFTLTEINTLELNYLEGLQYSVSVDAATYPKYYFRLRDRYEAAVKSSQLTPKSKDGSILPQRTLDQRSAQKLEALSNSAERNINMLLRRRKLTCDESTRPLPRAVIS